MVNVVELSLAGFYGEMVLLVCLLQTCWRGSNLQQGQRRLELYTCFMSKVLKFKLGVKWEYG